MIVSRPPGRNADPRGAERTTCYYQGYKYCKSWESNQTISFRCSCYRSTGCRGTMSFSIATMGYQVRRPHTCRDIPGTASLIDVSDPMRAMVDGQALSNLALPASAIWAAVRAHFYGEESEHVVRGMSQTQVESRVYYIRERNFGASILGVVDGFPLGAVLNSTMPFIQAVRSTPNDDATKPPNRILLWGHPVLINLLRYHNISLFIDGTFRCVPRKFAQCVVVMVHDRASGLFVPVFYALTTNRTSDTYWDLLHEIIQATDQQINPADVVCDFEQGLISAVQSQFPNAEVIGCLFHFKQAVSKKMKKLRIPPREIAIAMTTGVLDMLTTIDQDSIDPHGIKWVKKEIKARCASEGLRYSKPKWMAFWAYFVSTWINTYGPPVWNVHGLDNALVARTNNPLERFNRELNAAFPTPHPTLSVFIGTINAMSVRYVDQLADIPRGRARRVPRETITLPTPIVFPVDVTDTADSGDDSVPSESDDDMPSVSESGSDINSESDQAEDGGVRDGEEEIDNSFDYEGSSVSSASQDFGDAEFDQD